MPGIVGLTQGGDGGADPEIVAEMQTIVTHRDFYDVGPVTGDDAVRGGSSLHFPPSDPIAANEYHDERLHVWLHGEFIRTRENARRFDLDGRPTGAAFLAALYRACDGWDFLAELDGLFCAAIYDAERESVHLLTDPWGLKFLYWTDIDGALAWGSEAKAFLGHPDFEPTIDRQTVDHFVKSGQVYGNETWFRDVQLVSAGSVLTRDLNSGRHTETEYWHWREIAASSEQIDLDTAAHRMGELLCDAAEARSREPYTYGLGLSGGLDSRALLAAVPDEVRAECVTLTFGHPDCRDVHVARQVAERAGLETTVFPIDETNWFDGRVEGVWLTDGQWSLQHMHSLACLPSTPQMFDLQLSGALGGGILGADYEGFGGRPLEEVVATRGRRLINQGRPLYESFRHVRWPYLDRALVDFTLSLPRDLIRDGRTYRTMLLTRFSEFFRDIPDANTGRPIGWSRLREGLDRKVGEPLRNLKKWLPFADDPPQPMYVDYYDWFGGPSYRDEMESILLGESTLYREFVPHLPVGEMWEAQSSGNKSGDWKILSRALTFEIWLQQVFNQRWRGGLDRSST